MENILKPAVGSNQHLVRFDEKAKAKRKFRFKVSWKVKLALTLIIVANFCLSYFLLKQFVSLHCSEGGWLMSKEQCNTQYQNKLDSQELYRQQVLDNNPDLK